MERARTTPTPRPDRPLDGKQKRHLRGLAHSLSPVVNVGKEGVEPGVIAAVRDALRAHELIKVRVLEAAPLDRGEAAERLAAETGAHVAGAVGRVVILYRMHEEKPKITLPKASKDAAR